MESSFPHHPCVLARTSNPSRRASLDKPFRDRCAPNSAGHALRSVASAVRGDKSLAEFLLADDLLAKYGFSVSEMRCTASQFPALALLRARSSELSEPGDCIIEPLENEAYFIVSASASGERLGVECKSLAEA